MSHEERSAESTADLLTLDATDLTRAVRDGRTTAVEVTRLYLDRIEAHAELRAVIEVNPQALADAEALDRAGSVLGPLHGVPVLVKDNVDTAGPLHTTAGSWTLADHAPERDAPLVARLRAAGAVILGKTALTEWANFTTVGMPNGFSSRGGQVRSAWGEGLDVGGSSSGSGVAVSARLAPVAVGTETSGSILSPASSNGVVGLKPTLGFVPRTGVIPISSSQDTAGPITRSARDAALLMSVMSGVDDTDDLTTAAPAFEPPAFSPDALAGVRLGVVRSLWSRLGAETTALLDAAIRELSAAGATVEDVELTVLEDLGRSGLEVLIYEFKRDLNRYLAGVRRGPSSLREVIDLNDAHPEHVPYGQVLLLAAEATSGTLTEASYLRARARDLELTRDRGLDPLFGAGYAAVLSPGNWMAHVGAKAGYPSVTVPVGRASGTPVGLTLTGPAWSDARLLAFVDAYEARRGAWEAAR